jgi:hypothetical protein
MRFKSTKITVSSGKTNAFIALQATYNGKVTVFVYDTQANKFIVNFTNKYNSPLFGTSFSSDGRMLAALTAPQKEESEFKDKLVVMELETGKVKYFDELGFLASDPAWLANESKVIANCKLPKADNQVCVVDVEKGTVEFPSVFKPTGTQLLQGLAASRVVLRAY